VVTFSKYLRHTRTPQTSNASAGPSHGWSPESDKYDDKVDFLCTRALPRKMRLQSDLEHSTGTASPQRCRQQLTGGWKTSTSFRSAFRCYCSRLGGFCTLPDLETLRRPAGMRYVGAIPAGSASDTTDCCVSGVATVTASNWRCLLSAHSDSLRCGHCKCGESFSWQNPGKLPAKTHKRQLRRGQHTYGARNVLGLLYTRAKKQRMRHLSKTCRTPQR
jgi:hypothetical protein